MIGAMPAIAVRRGGKKGDGSIGYFNRPHKLSLHFRPPLTHHQVTPTPSPINATPGVHRPETSTHRLARQCANKRFIFQLSVLAPLVGALTLFIGLVQMTPGAEGSSYRIPLIVIGTAILIFGLLVIAIRMLCKWELGKACHQDPLPEIKVNDASCNDQIDVEKAEKENLIAIETSSSNNKEQEQHQQPLLGANTADDQQVLREVVIDGNQGNALTASSAVVNPASINVTLS